MTRSVGLVWLQVGALLLGLTLLMTWPAVGQLRSHVVGSGGDPWQTLWRFEDKAQLLANRPALTREFLGHGEPRLVNLSVWPWMALHLVFGEPLAYNLVWIVSFWMSGVAMVWLSWLLLDKDEGFSWQSRAVWASVLAGIFYMFLPFHVAHAQGHFGAMQLLWLPLIIGVFISWWRKPVWGKLPVLAGLLVIQAWVEHHYIVWLLGLALLAVGFYRQALWERWQHRRQDMVALGGVLLVAGTLIYVSLRPTLQLSLQEGSYLSLGNDQSMRFSADLAAFVTPSSFHSVWGDVTEPIYSSVFTGNVAESTHYLGLSVVLFLVFFQRTVVDTTKRFWLWATLLFLIVSLGPQLKILGWITHIPLPYALVQDLPILDSVRAVGRASVFVGLGGAALLALVAYAQVKRISMAMLFGGLILFEFLFMPVASQAARVPLIYEEVADLPHARILEIPAATNYVTASRALYASVRHQKEVLGSIALERADDPRENAFLKNIPAVRQLLYLRTTDLREDRVEFFGQSLHETWGDAARFLDIGAVVIHPDSLSLLQDSVLRTWLTQKLLMREQLIEDASLYVVDYASLPPSDGVFAVRGSGFEGVGFDPKRNSVFAEIPDKARLHLINVLDELVQVRVRAQIFEAADNPRATVYLDGQLLREVAADASEFDIVFDVLPGQHSLDFETQGGRLILQNPIFESTDH